MALVVLIDLRTQWQRTWLRRCTVIYKKPIGEDAEDLGDVADEGDDEDPGQLKRSVEPGQSDVLPEGYDVEQLDTKHPNMGYAGFQKAILKNVAASVGISYHALTSDLEAASYGSLRQGALDERDTHREHQQWLIENLLQPLFEEWLYMALEFRRFNLGFKVENFDKYNKPLWHPRTWAWIDPGKETASIKAQLDYKLISRTQASRELGFEYVDVLNEIEAENQLAADRGITLDMKQLEADQIQKELGTGNEPADDERVES